MIKIIQTVLLLMILTFVTITYDMVKDIHEVFTQDYEVIEIDIK